MSGAVPIGAPPPAAPPPGDRRRTPVWIWVTLGVLAALIVMLLVLLLRTRPTAAAPASTASTSAASVSAGPTPRAAASVVAKPGLAPTPTPTVKATGSGSSGSGSSGSGGSGSGGGSGSTGSSGSGGGTVVPAPKVTSVTASPGHVACVAPGAPGVDPQLTFDITLTWATAHATGVYVGVDTNDPKAEPFSGPLGSVGSVTVPFSCYGPHTYAVVAIADDGRVSSVAKVTVTNTGDPDPNR